MRAYRGHLIHVSGAPRLAEAAEHLVSHPDGVLVVDDAGRIVFSGSFAGVPPGAEVIDCRPGFLLPGFVDTHVHFPQTYCGDSYGGGQLLEWLNRCIFPSESRFADPDFAAAGGRRLLRPPDRAPAPPRRWCSVRPSRMRRTRCSPRRSAAVLRIVSGRGIQTVGPASAAPLITSEDDAIRLTSEEIEKWHAADTGDVDTALLHVAIVPRFSLSVTPRR